MQKKNKYKILQLTQGMVAIIDAEDFRRVNKYSWHVHRSAGSKRRVGAPYARACINGKKVYLHRFIMNTPEFLACDHKNHCTLDCRKENLENVCPVENIKRRRQKKR